MVGLTKTKKKNDKKKAKTEVVLAFHVETFNGF